MVSTKCHLCGLHILKLNTSQLAIFCVRVWYIVSFSRPLILYIIWWLWRKLYIWYTNIMISETETLFLGVWNECWVRKINKLIARGRMRPQKCALINFVFFHFHKFDFFNGTSLSNLYSVSLSMLVFISKLMRVSTRFYSWISVLCYPNF